MTTTPALEKLRRLHPEWQPWLSIVETVLHECDNRCWDRAVPDIPTAGKGEARLAGATITLEVQDLEQWVSRLFRTATASGAPRMAQLRPLNDGADKLIGLFHGSLCRDEQSLNRLAAGSAADREAFIALAELVAIPFLQACGRRWGASTDIWTQGFCPVCAAWPAFAELRGIDRSRYLRCGRCGADWQVTWLRCPYCNTSDHDQLTTLVPEDGSRTRSIEACRRCRCYVKSFNVLEPSAGARVILDDLESVDLDVAAVDEGYKRAAGLGSALDVNVSGKQTTNRKLRLWNR